MRIIPTLTLITACLILVAPPMVAQEEPNSRPNGADTTDSDTSDVYVMGAVTVYGSDRRLSKTRPLASSFVSIAEISKNDPATVSDVVEEAPSTRVQTNSRGEALIYVRNAGERQVGLFLDGALLNIPWDNRIDLSLVPLNAVGGIVAERGAPSALYGANVMGGAVNVVSRERKEPGMQTTVKGSFGQYGNLSGSVAHLGRTGSFNYVTSLSYTARDGVGLPKDHDLRYNQLDADVRTNTDRRLFSVYSRGEYHFSESARVGLALNFSDAEKGIAPEGHKDPADGGVRFWRYPDWQYASATGTYDFRFGEYDLWGVRGAMWGTKFNQRIEQYASAEYDTVTEYQQDDDLTLGLRTVLSRSYETGDLSFAYNHLMHTHDQRDVAVDSFSNEIASPEQRYAQNTFSLGVEYAGKIGRSNDFVLGATVDGMITTESGDKPEQGPFWQPGVNIGFSRQVSETVALRLSAGYKSRFPTLRELYGAALRRFLINPDLEPESALSGDVGLQWLSDGARVRAALFVQRVYNTIDQKSVDTLGSTRRQRINLNGSRVPGIEMSLTVPLLDGVELSGDATYSVPRAIPEEGDQSGREAYLAEKPELLASVEAVYDRGTALNARTGFHYTGVAYSLNDDNEFVRLDPAATINARVGWRFVQPMAAIDIGELWIRVDNLLDATVLYQLGLPASGRELRGGLSVSL